MKGSFLEPFRAAIEDYPVPFLAYLTQKRMVSTTFLENNGTQDYKQSYRAFLEFLEYQVAKMSGLNAVTLISSYFETLIQDVTLKAELEWKRLYPSSETHFCLIGLGGLARRDLCPYSDLDLLFLYDYKLSPFFEFLIERTLYTLWDLKLDIGYSVRSVSELQKDFDEDVSFALSLVDRKFLYGSSVLYQSFLKSAEGLIRDRAQRGLVWSVAHLSRSRHQKNLDTIHLLEPNIKEGKGGLRDFHSAWWVMKSRLGARSLEGWVRLGMLSPQEKRGLLRALSFIWQVRTLLHLMTGKRTDRLDLSLQERLAFILNPKTTEETASVEGFMRRYYAHARRIEELSLRVLSAVSCVSLPSLKVHREAASPLSGPFLESGYGVWLKDSSWFDADPTRILEPFLLIKESGLSLSYTLKRFIRKKRMRIDRECRGEPKTASLLMQICGDFRRVGFVFRELDRTGVLGRLIPEWERIENLAQHDIYHAYTVDKHLIKALEAMEMLASGQAVSWLRDLGPLFHQERKPAILIFGALLHDIGKGWGRGHSYKGAHIAGRILNRLGIEDDIVEEVVFLVRYHLLMMDYAFKRDLDEPALIERFLSTVETKDRLRRLYLLSICDLLAVSPLAMTPWKKGLLEGLFQRSHDALELRKEGKRPISVPEYAKEARVSLEPYLADLPSGKDFLSVVPNPYLLGASIKLSQAHAKLYGQAKTNGVAIAIEVDPSKFFAHVDVVAKDKLGLFSLLVGGLSCLGCNILWSRIYTTSDGYALDRFKLQHPSLEDLLKNPSYMADFKETLKNIILQGESVLIDWISRKRPAISPLKPPPRTRPNEVTVDNSLSEDYSVIDVKTYDRPFLLYEISRVFVANRLDIAKANIATIGDQVVDTFYVTDLSRDKIDEPTIKKLVHELLTVIECGGSYEFRSLA